MRVTFAILAGLLMLSGCASGPGDGPDIEQGSIEQTNLELKVLDALGEDAPPAGARYSPAEEVMYLTLYVRDDAMTDDEVDALRQQVEDVLETDGIRLEVELDEGPPPVEH